MWRAFSVSYKRTAIEVGHEGERPAVPAVLGPGVREVLPVMVEEPSTTGIARQV